MARAYCRTGHCSPLYMSHIKRGELVGNLGKDAIHFDLIESHEWNIYIKKEKKRYKRSAV